MLAIFSGLAVSSGTVNTWGGDWLSNDHVHNVDRWNMPCSAWLALQMKGRWERVRIQYKCLVPIDVFPEMKLQGLVISKTELYCSVSQFPHSCICEQFIYSQDCRNWERGPQFSFWEYRNRIFGTVLLAETRDQCRWKHQRNDMACCQVCQCSQWCSLFEQWNLEAFLYKCLIWSHKDEVNAYDLREDSVEYTVCFWTRRNHLRVMIYKEGPLC